MSDNKKSIRILMVDDHQIVLNGLRSLLKGAKGIHIVSEALSGKEALSILNKNSIDLMIIDISMPEIDGIELSKIVKSKYPEIKILILTVHDEQEMLNEILYLEVEGCLLKNTSRDELVCAIYKIMDNGNYYCNEIVDVAMDNCKTSKSKKKSSILSKRELEILELILLALPAKKIADILHISHTTVDTHRRNIMNKTNCNNFAMLNRYAIENDLFPHIYTSKNKL